MFLYLEIHKTNTYFYSFALIETIALVGVSIWQSYYMKHLFEVKGTETTRKLHYLIMRV